MPDAPLTRRASLPMQTRLARIDHPSAAADPDEAIELTWSTGAQVRRWELVGWDEVREVREELDLSGALLDRLNAGAPVLDSHRSWGLESVIGVVERAWVEGQAGKARIRLSQRPEVAGIRADIAAGILRNVSIGYAIHEAVRLPAEKRDEPDLIRVTRFEPLEISLVPVPADAGAQVQRDGQATAYPLLLRSEDVPMSTATDPVTAEPVTTDLTAPPTAGDHPAEPGPAVPAPAATAEALAEAHRAGMAAERQRAVAITNLCAQHQATAFTSDFLARGLAVAEVQERLDLLRRYLAANGPELHPGITRSQDTGSWQAVVDKLKQQQGTHP